LDVLGVRRQRQRRHVSTDTDEPAVADREAAPSTTTPTDRPGSTRTGAAAVMGAVGTVVTAVPMGIVRRIRRRSLPAQRVMIIAESPEDSCTYKALYLRSIIGSILFSPP